MKSRCLSFEGRIKRDLVCLHKTVIAKHARLNMMEQIYLTQVLQEELESQK